MSVGLFICFHHLLEEGPLISKSHQSDHRSWPFQATYSTIARSLTWGHPYRFPGVSLPSSFYLTLEKPPPCPFPIISFSTLSLYPPCNPSLKFPFPSTPNPPGRSLLFTLSREFHMSPFGSPLMEPGTDSQSAQSELNGWCDVPYMRLLYWASCTFWK